MNSDSVESDYHEGININFQDQSNYDSIREEFIQENEKHIQQCEICTNQTKNFKICIFCEEMKICVECENKHIHPLMKSSYQHYMNKNICNNSFWSRIGSSSISQLISAKIKNKIELFIKILPFQKKFFISPGEEFQINVIVQNTTILQSIPSGLSIIPLNNKDIIVESFKYDKEIAPSESLEVKLNCKAPLFPKNISIRLLAIHHNCDSSIITISEMTEINIQYDNNILAKELLSNTKEINGLSREQQIQVLELILSEITVKSPEEIISILIKHNWIIEAAIDELA